MEKNLVVSNQTVAYYGNWVHMILVVVLNMSLRNYFEAVNERERKKIVDLEKKKS